MQRPGYLKNFGKITFWSGLGQASMNWGSPVILDFNPKEGAVGDVISINGRNLQNAQTILFGVGPGEIGVPASSTNIIFDNPQNPSQGSSTMTAVVPPGVKPGRLAIQTPSGPIRSNATFYPKEPMQKVAQQVVQQAVQQQAVQQQVVPEPVSVSQTFPTTKMTSAEAALLSAQYAALQAQAAQVGAIVTTVPGTGPAMSSGGGGGGGSGGGGTETKIETPEEQLQKLVTDYETNKALDRASSDSPEVVYETDQPIADSRFSIGGTAKYLIPLAGILLIYYLINR